MTGGNTWKMKKGNTCTLGMTGGNTGCITGREVWGMKSENMGGMKIEDTWAITGGNTLGMTWGKTWGIQSDNTFGMKRRNIRSMRRGNTFSMKSGNTWDTVLKYFGADMWKYFGE